MQDRLRHCPHVCSPHHWEVVSQNEDSFILIRCDGVQRYFGTAIGKGRQSAKTDIEKLKLTELSCRQGVVEVAKM